MPSLRRTVCALAVAGAPLGALIGASGAQATTTPEPPPAPTIASPQCDLDAPCFIDQSRPSITVSGIKPTAEVALSEYDEEGNLQTLEKVPGGAGGTVTLTPPVLADGYHGLVITQTVGPETSDQAYLPLDIETAAPWLSTNLWGPVTNNATPTFYLGLSGLSEEELNERAGMQLIDAGTGQTLAEVTGEDGEWKPTSPLADGTYSVYAVAVDDFGNVGAHSNTFSFTVKTVPPATPALTSPANGSTVTTATPSLTTTGNAAGDVVCAIVDSETASEQVACQAADANGDTTQTFENPLGNGQHTVTVFAYDEAGNGSGTTTSTFVVNTPNGTPAPSPAPAPAPVSNPTPPAPPKLVGLAGKSLTLTAGHPVKIGIAVSGPGTITLTLTHKVHGKTKVVGTVIVKVTKAGKTSYTLASKFAGHVLAKGGYTLTLQALSGGQHSGTVSVPVKVGGKA